MEPERYIVESTWANGSKLIHIYTFDDIVKDLNEKYPVRRYFKLPDVNNLEEVSIEVLIKDLRP